jgi:hypothetical protein
MASHQNVTNVKKQKKFNIKPKIHLYYCHNVLNQTNESTWTCLDHLKHLKMEKIIMCITDGFSNFSDLISIPDKCAETKANALFTRWLCRHGLPLEIVSDQGKEFCNEIVEKLLALLK